MGDKFSRIGSQAYINYTTTLSICYSTTVVQYEYLQYCSTGSVPGYGYGLRGVRFSFTLRSLAAAQSRRVWVAM